MKRKVLFIAGPTASGKTKTSVFLAKKLDGEIISADSMQVYKKMDIGTAKVTSEEMEGIPHYMIDLLDPSEPCNVSWFKDKVKYYIEDICSRGKTPIIVGGTGFYLNAILFDTHFEAKEDDTLYRNKYIALSNQYDAMYLHNLLKDIDPLSAETIHPNNVKRVIRALAYYDQFKKPISSHNEEEKQKKIDKISPYDYTFILLTMPRSILYERINQRVDQMIAEGLIAEVKYFYDHNYSEDLTSMKAIGYKEFFPYFKEEASLEACIEKLKQATRQYAKRQLTWFKHQTDATPIDVAAAGYQTEVIANEIMRCFRV